MADLVTTLKDAAHIKAVAQVTPEIEKLGKIVGAVASYQEAVIEAAEVAIVNVALAALGQPEVKPELDAAALKTALLTAMALVLGVETTSKPVPHPSSIERVETPLSAGQAAVPFVNRSPRPHTVTESKSPPSEHSRKPGVSIGVPSNPLEGVNLPVATATPPSGPKTFASVLEENPPPKPVVVNPLDIEKAWALVNEVEGVDCASEPVVKVEMLFQAWAAEARLIMEKLPPGNAAHEALGERVIRHVTNLKKDLGVVPYIKGLAFGASANWYRISVDSRKRLRRFDRDAQESVEERGSKGAGERGSKKGRFGNPVLKTLPVLSGSSGSSGSPAPAGSSGSSGSSGSPAPASYTWPDLSLLRKRMEESPLLIIGGRTRDTLKVDVIYERYGVRCEWCEIDPGSTRQLDALSERIANGKVAGILLVENFLSHKAYRRFKKASDQGVVPLGMTGKGGIGAIGEALQRIERQASIDLYQIPKIPPPASHGTSLPR